MSRQPTKESFLKDVSKHELNIFLDNGVYRHIRLRAPNTSNQYFDLVTWPGYLAYSGDMGSFVFTRLQDMFEFFRKDGGINPQYWGEKLEAYDRADGFEKFSPEKYKTAIKSDFEEWEFDSPEDRKKSWDAIEFWGLLDTEDLNTIDSAMRKVYDYKCEYTGNYFPDFWDHNLKDYTYRFMWCCYAIQWAIGQYDEVKGA